MAGIHLIVALVKIIAYGVERIVYISCKPTSLARDLEVFFEKGYRMEKAVAVDMFPATANIETVVLLSKLKADDYIDVGENYNLRKTKSEDSKQPQCPEEKEKAIRDALEPFGMV